MEILVLTITMALVLGEMQSHHDCSRKKRGLTAVSLLDPRIAHVQTISRRDLNVQRAHA